MRLNIKELFGLPTKSDELTYWGIKDYKKAEYQSALNYFNKALEVDPNNIKAKENIEKVLEKLNTYTNTNSNVNKKAITIHCNTKNLYKSIDEFYSVWKNEFVSKAIVSSYNNPYEIWYKQYNADKQKGNEFIIFIDKPKLHTGESAKYSVFLNFDNFYKISSTSKPRITIMIESEELKNINYKLFQLSNKDLFVQKKPSFISKNNRIRQQFISDRRFKRIKVPIRSKNKNWKYCDVTNSQRRANVRVPIVLEN